MNNLLACFIFNLSSLGMSYFLSLFMAPQNSTTNWGSSVFWGSWVVLLLTYGVWLVMPNQLNMACYIAFFIAFLGCIFLFVQGRLFSFFKSEYFIALLILAPFLFVVCYIPRHCDELSHWMSLPKVFYTHNSLVADETWFTANYTPLWTLQATFYQFFSPSAFDSSLVYAVRINVLLAFFFFIKEEFGLSFLKAFIFSLGGLILFFITKSAQNLLIEAPICMLLASTLFLIDKESPSKETFVLFCISFVSLYMLKKPLIAVLPAALYVLWSQGYKKQLIYFLLLFGAVFFSWKFKTSHMSEPWQWQNNFKIDGLWSEQAIAVYKKFMGKTVHDGIRTVLFLLCMGIIFKYKRRAFTYYLLFAGFYLIGLVLTYVFVFGNNYEQVINASYVRYIKVAFVPTYVYALYLLVTHSGAVVNWDAALNKKAIPRYAFSLGIALLFICFFLPTLSGCFYKTEASQHIEKVK